MASHRRGTGPFDVHDTSSVTPAQLAAARAALDAASWARRARAPLPADATAVFATVPWVAVHHAAEQLLLERCARAWATGWQPAELVRQARLQTSTAAAARLVALAVAADHVARRSTTLHPRWVAQVEGLALPAADGAPGWAARWAAVEGLLGGRAAVVLADALASVQGLRVLPTVLPPPGAPDAPVDPAWSLVDDGSTADPVLQRIRNLLAKAESTTFEAEALAFTAKAQELMTRHAIDNARLVGAPRAGATPVARRLAVDPPYFTAKASLLGAVAQHARARSVLLPDVSLVTVIGFAEDVAAVEALFTSLLVQADQALLAAVRAARAAGDDAAGSRSYRRSFLLAFAGRVEARLREINDGVLAAARAEHGDAFLPVLASRDAAVAAVVDEQFGVLRTMRLGRSVDPAGWSSGRAAGDRARLSHGDLAREPRGLRAG